MAINDTIFAVGGGYTKAMSYSPETNTWTTLSTERNFPGAAAVGNFVYVFGGFTKTNVVLSNMESFNIATNTSLGWTAGLRATAHRVYLGTDSTAVSTATPATGMPAAVRVRTASPTVAPVVRTSSTTITPAPP